MIKVKQKVSGCFRTVEGAEKSAVDNLATKSDNVSDVPDWVTEQDDGAPLSEPVGQGIDQEPNIYDMVGINLDEVLT